MRKVKYVVLCILCFIAFRDAYTQNKSRVPAGVDNIFDDLPVDDPAKNSVLRPGEDSIQKIKKNIFVTGVISKSHCFLGEPILLTYTLFSALQSTSTIERAPSFAGFSSDIMQTDNEQVKRKKQDGKNYRVFTIQQVQLVPLQEGVLTIDPISVYNEVSYKENKSAVHYGGSTGGKAIMISVDPLPVEGRPAGFSGATGNFTMRVTADTVSAAGENNSLHVEIAGSGNFTTVSAPEVTWPAGCEHFSVSSGLQINKNSFPSSGKKIFDIPFVPAKEGILVIPAMQFGFFDTQKKAYRFAYSNPVTIHVSPALHKPLPNAPLVPVKKQFPFYYFLLPLLFLLALTGMIFYKRKKAIPVVVPTPALHEPAPSIYTKDMYSTAELETLKGVDNTNEYTIAFKKLFTAFLRQQTGNASGTEDTLLAQIKIKDTELAAAAGLLFAQCNSLLYAPGNTDMAMRLEMENKLVSISQRVQQVFV